MKKIILVFAVLFINDAAYSQKEADKWFFGNYAGLDFSSGTAVGIVGGMVFGNEGFAAISDSAGNLLFYTDANTVWNRIHQVMPNGTGLLGGTSSTQGSLIVPLPGSSSVYYIFTTDEIGGPNGFRYSTVDMTLQGGLGDVTPTKNVLILNSVTEKLTAIRQNNSSAYWVAVHEWGSDAFYVYSLTSAGLLSTPVISNAGIVHNTSQIQNTNGQMKFNPCGDRIALAIGNEDTVEVLDFDNATGIISNPISIPFTMSVYGLEFSRDGLKLYVTSHDPSQSSLDQFDLSSGVASTIIGSQTNLANNTSLNVYYGLQLANDKKIYVCKSWDAYLGVVNDPTLAGTACNYADQGVFLDPASTGIVASVGLPSFVQSFFKGEIICPEPSAIPELHDATITVYPNPCADHFNLHVPFNASEILITDATGRNVERITNPKKQISLGHFYAEGIYFVFVKGELHTQVMKVVKTMRGN